MCYKLGRLIGVGPVRGYFGHRSVVRRIQDTGHENVAGFV